jgi:hypothetical protein
MIDIANSNAVLKRREPISRWKAVISVRRRSLEVDHFGRPAPGLEPPLGILGHSFWCTTEFKKIEKFSG